MRTTKAFVYTEPGIGLRHLVYGLNASGDIAKARYMLVAFQFRDLVRQTTYLQRQYYRSEESRSTNAPLARGTYI